MSTIQFLLSQSPLFWFLLTGFFFAMGVYWAHQMSSPYRLLLDVATDAQALLVGERDDLLAVEAVAMHGNSSDEVELVQATAFEGNGGYEGVGNATVQTSRIRFGTRRRYRNGNQIHRDKTDPAS